MLYWSQDQVAGCRGVGSSSVVWTTEVSPAEVARFEGWFRDASLVSRRRARLAIQGMNGVLLCGVSIIH